MEAVIATGQIKVTLGAMGSKGKGIEVRILRTNGDPDFASDEIDSVQLESLETIESICVKSVLTGYWTKVVDGRLSADLVVNLDPLPNDGPLSWWHRFHGIENSDPSSGAGLRVGIIDEFHLPTIELPDGVTQIPPSEIGASEDDPRFSSEHADAIISLVARNAEGQRGYSGIAPGAKYFFISAKDRSEDDPVLNPTLVANAIELLADKYLCDIVTVSAGDSPVPLPEIETAVKMAKKRGCLTFFAAGNSGELLYPANYEDCIAVGAVGCLGTAPEDSWECFAEDGIGLDDIHFISSMSPMDVDLVAAGVNVIWSAYGRAARAVSGTSYAAPVSAALCARLLAKDFGAWKGKMGVDLWNAKRGVLLRSCSEVKIQDIVVRIPTVAISSAAVAVLDE